MDLSKVKPEPVEDDHNQSGGSGNSSKQADTTEKDSNRSKPELASLIRFTRARYIRRNYSSPESSVCEVCQAEFAGPGERVVRLLL